MDAVANFILGLAIGIVITGIVAGIFIANIPTCSLH